MAKNAEPTTEDLVAQQAALTRQIAERSTADAEAAVAILDGLAPQMAELSAIIGRLPDGLARQTLNSVAFAYDSAKPNMVHVLAILRQQAT